MTEPEEKTQRILAAALDVFGRYGFRKTSMQDVADAAGMSRAALYLHFRNKEDLFRSGSASVHADVLARTEAVFAGPGTFFRRLEAGLHSFAVGLMAPLSAGNHAQELFDVNMALAADVSEQAKQRFLQLIRKAVTQAAATGEIRLGAHQDVYALADLIHAAMHGFKQADGDIPALERRITLFVALLATALGNPPPPARTAQRRRRIA